MRGDQDSAMKIVEGALVQLRRVVPVVEVPELQTCAGFIVAVHGPVFYVEPIGGSPRVFRIDENEERAVSVVDASVWEIVRTIPPRPKS
jgi:hypothetical protein